MPLFVGLFLLGMASNLIASLIALRMSREGFADLSFGLVAAGFALGGIIGANVSPKLVARAGHFRSFAALAALLACVVLGHALTATATSWAGLRLVTGIVYYGLVLVVESWLNEVADERTRGRLLATYMVIFFGSGAVGQLFLNLRDPNSPDLFIVAAMLLSISVVPMTLTSAIEPAEQEIEPVALRDVLADAPVPAIGAFCAGMVVGTFYGLGAAYADRTGLGTAEVSLFMVSVIAGALCLQWPLGWLSDRIQRKVVIGAAALVTSVCAVAIILIEQPGPALYAMAFVFGGTGFSLYPLNLAQASDRIRRSLIVGLSGRFLTIFAAGSTAGPLAAGALLAVGGDWAIFAVPAVAAAVLAVFAYFLPVVPQVLKKVFVSVPLHSLGGSSLDPRQSDPGRRRDRPRGDDAAGVREWQEDWA